MINYQPVKTDDESLAHYASLLKTCFPTAPHLTPSYLKWLYVGNPCGTVIGMDAVSDGVLAAHYACVPTRISLEGKEVAALLSLNTATHPDFRGKGLFTKLADATYDAAAQDGFVAVYGVANANSTPGFVRKLGFQLVSPLDARLGLGRQLSIKWDRVVETAQFRRVWDEAQMEWRVRNPSNPIHAVKNASGYTELYAKTDRNGIMAWGESPVVVHETELRDPAFLFPRLFLGLTPLGCARSRISLPIPSRLRPSPLNFIVRPLTGSVTLDKSTVSFSFIDFDAY